MTQKQRQLILGLFVLTLILLIALLRIRQQSKLPRESWIPSNPPIFQTIFTTSGEEIPLDDNYQSQTTEDELKRIEAQLADVTKEIRSNASRESYVEWQYQVEDLIRKSQRHGDINNITRGNALLEEGFLKFYEEP